MLSIPKKKTRGTDIRAANSPKGAAWLAHCAVRLLVGALILVLTLDSGWAAADAMSPLKPLDISSPRATLKNFLNLNEELGRFLRDIYHDTPSRANWQQMVEILSRASRALDLSEVPPAARRETGFDAVIMLYDVLAIIELPPDEAIPDAAAYAEDEKRKPARWTIPQTEITIARLQEGARQGEFLFSAETVRRMPEFYRRVRDLPNRRLLPLENLFERRQLAGGEMFPLQVIERLPAWLHTIVFGQAVWKLLALAILLILVVGVLALIFRWAYRGPWHRHRPGFYFHRLSAPLGMIMLAYVVSYFIDDQFNMTGGFSPVADLIVAAIIYGAVAWGAWYLVLGIAEGIITYPKISDESLDEHLLRMAARIIGILAVFGFLIYAAHLVGVPLLGLITGAGVFGLAIALAAQDTLRAFLGSITIFLDKP